MTGWSIVALAALAVGFIISITAILTDNITKYKLKVEQIRADALVRTEEVKARNQLELEKLVRQESKYNAAESLDQNEELGKQKNRIRE